MIALLATSLAVRLCVALRPLAYIDGLTIPDDAYLSLTIARNIGHGLGPRYGGGFTNGFQPLYVFLVAPLFAWLHDAATPVHLALVLLALCDTLTLYCVLRLARRWSQTAFVPVVVGLAWALSPYVIATTVNGLETALATCCCMAAWTFAELRSATAPGRRDGIVLGLLLGLGAVARIDSVLLAPGLLAPWLLRRSECHAGLARRAAPWLWTMTGALLVVLPVAFYMRHFTGALLPVSGRAVRFQTLAQVGHHPTFANCYGPLLRDGALAIAAANLRPLVVVALALLLLATRGRGAMAAAARRLRRVAPAIAFSVLLLGAYVAGVYAPWYFPRYLYFFAPTLLLIAAVLADELLRRLPAGEARVAAGAALVAVLLGGVAGNDFTRLFTSTDTTSRGYMNVGLWARRTFPPGTVVGACQSGALGYFADGLTVVNLDGVVNEAAYRALVERRAFDYLERSRVAYVVDWAGNLRFILDHSPPGADRRWQRVGTITGFRSWGMPWVVMRIRR